MIWLLANSLLPSLLPSACCLSSSVFLCVADPHPFDADSDHTFQFDADTDPTTHFSQDSEPPMLQNDPLPVCRIRNVYPGSRILIFTHPGSRIPDLGSRIPDPKAIKETSEKKMFVIPVCSHKFQKIEHYFSFEVLKKKILGQFSKNYRTFNPKNCH
jgi:hypothetical protein